MVRFFMYFRGVGAGSGIRCVRKKENKDDEFKGFGLNPGKMEVLSAEMEKASREQIEVPELSFGHVTLKHLIAIRWRCV